MSSLNLDKPHRIKPQKQKRREIMWKCTKCGEKVDGYFDICWNCGTSKDGTEDPSFERPDADAEELELEIEAAEDRPPLKCLRCECSLHFVGTRAFDDGPGWNWVDVLVGVFANKERFDVYFCPQCGRVELFVSGVGEKFRPQ